MKEIRGFKYSPWISYGEAVYLYGFEVNELINWWLKPDKCCTQMSHRLL